MRLFSHLLCFSVIGCSSFFCLSIPGVNVDKKTLTSLGIKTIDWQDNNDLSYPQIQLHQNYSKVSHQTAQINNPHQLHNNYQEQRVLSPPPQNTRDNYNIRVEELKPTSRFESNSRNDQDNGNDSLKNKKYTQIEDIAQTESKFQEQDLTFYNRKRDERHPKKFFELTEPIYIHGFRYPPNPENVYSTNQPKKSYTECPKHSTGQFAYSYSCNQFLNCWKGRGFVSNCSPGTLFNPDTLECDYASKVKCSLKPSIQPSDVVAGNDLTCPPNFSGLIPHRNNCSKYISCVNGAATTKECRSGTLFSLKTNNCEFSQNAECASWYSNVGKVEDYEANSSGNDDTNKAVLSTTISKRKKLTSSGSTKQQIEIHEDSVLENDSQFITSKDETKLVNPINSNVFFRSTTPRSVYRASDISNVQGQEALNFNTLEEHNRRGDVHSKGHIENSNSLVKNVACPIGGTGLYPHPYDCFKFLNCANGQTFIQDCGPGTAFNPFTKVCDFPHKVDCSNSHRENHGENIINVRITEGRSDPGASPNLLLHRTNQITSHTNNLHGQDLVRCPAEESGLYPHPYICSKFLNCDRGRMFIQDCSPGTVFNPAVKVCDFPYNVDCGDTYGKGVIDIRMPTEPSENTYDNDIETQFTTLPTSPNQIHYEKRSTTTYLPPTYNNRKNSTLAVHVVGEVSSEIITHAPYITSPPIEVNVDYDSDDQFELEIDSTINEANHTISKNIPKFACDMFNFYCNTEECIPQSMVCDGNKDCSNAADEQNCIRFTNKYSSVKNSILAVREKEKFLNISIAYCAKTCLESKGFKCKSFNYRKDDSACFLSDLNVGSSGALITSHPYDYYELKNLSINCTNKHKCPNQKCIEFNQICNGINDCGDRSDEKGCSAEDFGYEIKLAGTNKKHEGRIEVKAFGKWGYICDDRFGLRNADVVCKELGFNLGSLEVKSNSYYAKDLNETDVFYLMDDVTCLGNETSLRDCDFNGWGVSNCESQEVVGIICKTPQETCPIDNWKCDTVQECIPLAFVCDGVFDCTDESDEGTQHCDVPTEIRLVNGNSKLEGRVEIRHHGIWGTICDDDFNDDAAKVVCKSLGFYGNAVAKKEGAFGAGTGPIWLDQVFCQGNETILDDCIHWNWGEHNCEHGEDVGVVCGTSQSLISHNNVEVIPKHRTLDILPDRLFPGRCGYKKDDVYIDDDGVHFRVIKGSIAKRGDYPWQASLRIKNKSRPTHWCGAIVISRKFVLTAAHCLIGFSKGAYIVTSGDYNTDEIEGTEQEAYIEEFYIHEKFRIGQKMNNDIALIKLKGDGFNFTRDVLPICLPEANKSYEAGINCTISGFGTIQSGVSGYSHDLRAGWIKMQPTEVCQMPHVYGSAITEGMICAGSLDEGVDACDGDSGGPLACVDNGLFTLYGITSWGQHCGHANKPGVYVKVSHYRNWIDDTIRKNS